MMRRVIAILRVFVRPPSGLAQKPQKTNHAVARSVETKNRNARNFRPYCSL